MKKRLFSKATALGMTILILSTTALAACSSAGTAGKIDLNSMTLAQIEEQAKKEGELDTVGMPDSWANWGETWKDYTAAYGIKHTDKDMSSAEELSVFSTEKANATKDMGDVGQSFGPTAKSQGLTLAYKTSYWNSIPDWAKDDTGNWIIGYYGTISIMTNSALVKNAPTSFADILAGDYMVSIGDVTKANQAQCAVLAAAIANGGSESNIQPGLDFFKKLAQQGRLDLGELSLARIQKGEVAVALVWDYNALGYRDQIKAADTTASFNVCIPSDGSVQSGYCTVINSYTKHPYAAALAREYILSDAGQINLARGYARPIRSDVVLPADVAAILLPDSEYKNAVNIKDASAWKTTVDSLGTKWQEQVIANAK
jgi:putative spermidine/putrescine transport system substrate-binding protein